MSKLFMCECGGEGIVVGPWFDDGEEVSVGFAVWGPRNRQMSLRAKWRRFWDVFVKGRMYVDDVILSPESAAELASYLRKPRGV